MTETNDPTVDFHGQLCQTLTNLRLRWPRDWPGLSVVLNACLSQRWPSALPKSREATAMLDTALAMAEHMEVLARTSTYEPHYHNRLHTADALVSLCWLLQALQAHGHAVSDDWTACLLMSVTSHDVLHPGGANSHLQAFESQSVALLTRMAKQHGVTKEWLDTASHLILHTDPTLVAANHDNVKHRPFVMNKAWAVVLMNEADILASATASFGPQLGRALASEWEYRQHPLHAVVGTDAGRLQFLSTLRFSTPASMALKMPAEVAQQMAYLKPP
ncbi:MAG: hypothetical protein ACKO69_05060 [Limnohabitans sp.]